MAAEWSQNELTSARKRCHLVIYTTGGAPAPRETDFNGSVYLFRGSPVGILSTGTVTNCRRPLVIANDAVEAVDDVNNRVQMTAHGYELGDGPLQWDPLFGAPPAPMAFATDYWVVPDGANHVKFATSLANAYAGVVVDITPGASVAQLKYSAATERGLDGDFVFEPTQAETNVDVSEIFAMVIKTGFDRARTSVSPRDKPQGFDALGEGASTYGDIMRAIYSALLGKSGDYTTGTYTFMDPTTGTIVRFTITADATGRIVVVPGNLAGP